MEAAGLCYDLAKLPAEAVKEVVEEGRLWCAKLIKGSKSKAG